jgi:NAD(P)-dependent dehydrogenase (short-subunit alcohol dehydrogenase family)
MKPGSSVINTASVTSDTRSQTLLAYLTTKGAIQIFTDGLAAGGLSVCVSTRSPPTQFWTPSFLPPCRTNSYEPWRQPRANGSGQPGPNHSCEKDLRVDSRNLTRRLRLCCVCADYRWASITSLISCLSFLARPGVNSSQSWRKRRRRVGLLPTRARPSKPTFQAA